MPRVVVISDVHGNLPALRAIWRDISRRSTEHVVFLGDLVAHGPEPRETLEFLRDEIGPAVALRGKTDQYLLDKVWQKKKKSKLPKDELESYAWTAKQLGKSGMDYLESLGEDQIYEVGGVITSLCHNSPDEEELSIVPVKTELPKSTSNQKADVMLCGYTHVPIRTRMGDLDVIGVGSVGLPFDGDVRACYLSFHTGHSALQEVHFCRVSYNQQTTVDRLAKIDLAFASATIYRLKTASDGVPRVNRP